MSPKMIPGLNVLEETPEELEEIIIKVSDALEGTEFSRAFSCLLTLTAHAIDQCPDDREGMVLALMTMADEIMKIHDMKPSIIMGVH